MLDIGKIKIKRLSFFIKKNLCNYCMSKFGLNSQKDNYNLF